MFGPWQQLAKINMEPLQAGPNLIKLSDKLKHLGGLLDNTLSCDQNVSSNVPKAMANFIIMSSPYADTSPRKHALHTS